jgi:adenylyltransferase/sulfurtransferase
MRYARQTILPEIGAEGQKRISAARILCIGAGGLGCAALPYLAAAGVGTIGICDDDRVELSNLQRQVLFKTAEVGALKAEKAAEALRALNPDIIVNAHPMRLDARNVENLFSRYDIILDGTDNFAAKFLINDAAYKLGKPWVYGAVLGFEGQVSVFENGNGPCYRCLYNEEPKNPVANCAEAGVLGAFVGSIGTMQAVEALKLAAKTEKLPTISGRLLMIDARNWQWRDYALEKAALCPTCSKNHCEVHLMTNDPNAVPEITAAEAAQLKTPVFLDVREPDEWDEGHIPGAMHIPVGTLLADSAPNVPRDAELVVYCRSGGRSKRALQHLQTLGYTNGKNMVGGFTSWSQVNPARTERAA